MSEHSEQAALFEWAAWHEGKEPRLRLLHAIPNGGKRDKATAAKLRAEGVKAGVPDVCLPVPSGDLHGLYIEMKHGRNKPTAHQEWWMIELRALGYGVAVCYSWQAAAHDIVMYLKGDVRLFSVEDMQ